jgi:hypothetical protein
MHHNSTVQYWKILNDDIEIREGIRGARLQAYDENGVEQGTFESEYDVLFRAFNAKLNTNISLQITTEVPEVIASTEDGNIQTESDFLQWLDKIDPGNISKKWGS